MERVPITLEQVKNDLDLIQRAFTGAWVVKMNGKCITLHSGKSVWKKKNHATSALANHFSNIYYWKDLSPMGVKDGTQLARKLVKEGILTVEQL